MFDFETYRHRFGRADWPVSTVRRRGLVKSKLEERLDEFEELNLSSQDEGFLRLARTILEGEGAPIDSDEGLMS